MDFSISLAMTVAPLAVAGVKISMQQSRSTCFVDMNRNKLIAEFLKTDCTHLVMIDDDMGWPADVLPKMLKADKEFIAAVGPMKVDSGDQFACEIYTNPDQTPKVVDGLISASRVGAAFLLLKRSMLEKMVKAYPDDRGYAVDKEFGYRFFQVQHTQNLFMTEDYSFCDKWRKIGGEIWIYPDCDFIHTGTKDFKGNYHKFLSAGVAQEPAEQGVKYSIVIVAYKAQEEIEKCLNSLAENPPGAHAEIIIVDNSPVPLIFNPDTLKALSRNYSISIVSDEGNRGFAEGCNVGARMAVGKYLTFVNPDTIVYPGWAEMLSEQLSEGVGAVGPVSNFVASLQNISYYKEVTQATDWAALAKELAESGVHRSIEAKLLIGFFLMVPRNVWDTVGEFDKEFVLGCDDLDYSLRLQQAGLKLKICPDVFVFHKGHASFKAEGSAALEMNQRSEARLRAKLDAGFCGKVPTSIELWGCDIFPTETIYPAYALGKSIDAFIAQAKDQKCLTTQ